jgi:hypothetical protein
MRKSLASLPLKRLTQRQRHALMCLDLLWQDSRAFMARVADNLRAAHPKQDMEPVILAMLRAAAETYYTAGRDDYERFGACVDALSAALERSDSRLVAKALSPQQRLMLARRVQPHEERTD